MKYLKRFESHTLEYIQQHYIDGYFNGIRVDWHKFQVVFILGCFKLFCKDGEDGKILEFKDGYGISWNDDCIAYGLTLEDDGDLLLHFIRENEQDTMYDTNVNKLLYNPCVSLCEDLWFLYYKPNKVWSYEFQKEFITNQPDRFRELEFAGYADGITEEFDYLFNADDMGLMFTK